MSEGQKEFREGQKKGIPLLLNYFFTIRKQEKNNKDCCKRVELAFWHFITLCALGKM
jgi:hypothetical protein